MLKNKTESLTFKVIETDVGTMTNKLENPVESKPSKYDLEKLKSSAGEMVRQRLLFTTSNKKAYLPRFKRPSRFLNEVHC